MKLLKAFSLTLALGALCFGSVTANPETSVSNAKVDSHEHHSSLSRSESLAIIIEVQQRFFEFQNATSKVKQVAHDPNTALEDAALDVFESFLNPNLEQYLLITEENFSYYTPAQVRTAYAEFAAFFNSWSQHYSNNVVVKPHHCGKKAFLTAGGGEWASVGFGAPWENITISNWEIEWVWLEHGPTGPNWYINNYKEFGDRLYQLCVPCGAFALTYARQFPGDTPEATVPACASCSSSSASAKPKNCPNCK